MRRLKFREGSGLPNVTHLGNVLSSGTCPVVFPTCRLGEGKPGKGEHRDCCPSLWVPVEEAGQEATWPRVTDGGGQCSADGATKH